MLLITLLALLSITHDVAFCHGILQQNQSKNAFRSVAYFVNWSVYLKDYRPRDLPTASLTHVLYAFANLDPQTGEVYLSNPFVDSETQFAIDAPSDNRANLYGCLGELYRLKQDNRHLKVLLSIGGWSYSSNFIVPASTARGRARFVSTAVLLVKNLGLDGLDIAWDFPSNDVEATNIFLILQALRKSLDVYSATLSQPYHFLLTVAAPAMAPQYEKLYIREMDQYVDFWNLMAYDYAGSWSYRSGNQANLFPSTSNPASTPFNTQSATTYYISQGVAPRKIVLGMPVYGREFKNTDGLGQPFDSIDLSTTGVYDFRSLPLSGATEFYDESSGSSYSYDADGRSLISYDTVPAARQKAFWVRKSGLGGMMWWESSADREGGRSLIANSVDVLDDDDSSLESTLNQLEYPDSTYDNIRNALPASTTRSDTGSKTLLPTDASTSSTLVLTPTAVPSITTSTAIIPGENGISGCAYVLARDLGEGALCALDYCNCGGTIAPLLTFSFPHTTVIDCNYQFQPTENICPTQTGLSMETTLEPIVTTSTTTLAPVAVTLTSTVVVTA